MRVKNALAHLVLTHEVQKHQNLACQLFLQSKIMTCTLESRVQAVINGHDTCVQALARLRVDIDSKTLLGRTPLHEASES